jgi:hypothetical protein
MECNTNENTNNHVNNNNNNNKMSREKDYNKFLDDCIFT